MSYNNHTISPRLQLAGLKFGLYTVLEYAGGSAWKCQCACGSVTTVLTANLTKGQSKSCGCQRAEKSRVSATRHGMADTPIHRSWMSMRQRCNNKNDKAFANYGGRGIRICERWGYFENFAEDMGPMPAGYEIDRIDVNGNYEPSNCRWASCKDQNRNKRNSHLITFKGETRCFAEWCEILNLSKGCLQKRFDLGWGLEKAFTTPARHKSRANSLVAKNCLEEIDGGKTASGRGAKLLRVPVAGQKALFQ
jgi:hypothetical protein